MEIFGYPLWTVALVCAGVFCAAFMDAIAERLTAKLA